MVNFIGGRKLEKNTDMPQVIDQPLSHNIVSSTTDYGRDSNSQHKLVLNPKSLNDEETIQWPKEKRQKDKQ
jgi:hypothetical protein